MCLTITKESLAKTKRAKARKTPITAWKIVDLNMNSFYMDFKWQTGENVSDRKSTKLTKTELKEKEIRKGFHFFLKEPKKCLYRRPCQHPCPRPCLRPFQCQYQCQSSHNELLKVEIQPKDVIAIGEWDDFECIATTKCVVVEN